MESPRITAFTAIILTLPPELLNHLLSTLTLDPTSYHTLLSLRLTHPIFFNHINLVTLKSQHTLLSTHYFQNEVAFIISDAHNRPSTTPDLWPCYICLHLQPRTNFAHSQTHASHSVAHAKARLRFCIDCGVRKGIYIAGTVLRCFHGPDKVVCLRCRRLGVSAKICGKVAVKLSPSSNSADAISTSGSSLATTTVRRADIPRNAINVDRDIRGLCMDCAYGEGSRFDQTEAGQNEVRRSKRLPGDFFVERLLGYQRSDQRDFSSGTGERKGRCQRCWAIDHTERAAHQRHGHQLLCQECWLRRWV